MELSLWEQKKAVLKKMEPLIAELMLLKDNLDDLYPDKIDIKYKDYPFTDDYSVLISIIPQ